jgi:A/G-specific adenine glycosylase
MQTIYKKLYAWYDREGRKSLPWRATDDPYHIYLSEVMLQQTQVKTVLERYYFPFLERFPSLQALADATLDEVLKMWEGLGYYSRAKNLHKTASLTAPKLPTGYEELLALPGIGENTAAAICAFAYGQKYAVMEANIRRIICRLYALDDPSKKELLKKAHALLDEDDPFTYNQAMMDIGATVCRLKEPRCEVCPFVSICQAHALGVYDFPVKKTKKVPIRRECVIVAYNEGRVSLVQRSGKFLHGLWGFPTATKGSGRKLGEVRHQYTHFKLEVTVYAKRCSDSGIPLFSDSEIDNMALSTVDKKILKLLEKEGITSRR